MDPLSMLTAGISLFGVIGQFGESQKIAEAQQGIAHASMQSAQAEMDINKQRHQEMILTAQRQQMQNIRNMQLARSMALSASVNQGAQFGSGLPGGQAQISGQGNNQVLGLNQNLTLGNKVFSDQNQVDEDRMGISMLQGQIATDQGQSALFGAIGQSAGPLGRLGATLFPGFGKSA